MSHSSIPEKTNSSVISDWRPEDPEFWQQRGHRVASRNLWISVPCLFWHSASGCCSAPLPST